MTLGSARPFTFALFGCGVFGTRHAEALVGVPTARLAAVWDPDLARAHRLGRCYGADVVASAGDLWQRGDIDGVILATPTATHHELTLAAARAGKHVLVEKPAALSVVEFDEMHRAAETAGTLLMVGQTLRFHDVSKALHRAAREGDIGQPVFFNWVSDSARSWPAGWQAWQTDPAQSGGMALHLGIHGIDLALWLLESAPERIYAQGANLASPGLAVYDSLQIGVRCANGANALIEVHLNLPADNALYQAATLLGTRGQAQWTTREESLSFSRHGARFVVAADDRELRDELAYFVECCQAGRAPSVTPTQVRWALGAALAANLALQTEQPVTVADILGMAES